MLDQKPWISKHETLLKLTGILKDKTIEDKFSYIPNDDEQNYPFCRLKLLVKSLETTSLL